MESASSLFRIVAEFDYPVCVIDRSGTIRSANPAFAGLMNDAPAGLEGTVLSTLLPSANAAWLQSEVTNLKAEHTPITSQIGRNTQRRHTVRLRVLPNGAPDGLMFVTATPVASGAASADTARAALELNTILENTAVGILFTRDRVIERCNARLAQIFGYAEPQALIGRPAMSLFPDAESYAQLGREANSLLAAGKAYQDDWLGYKLDGTPVWTRLYAKAIDPGQRELGTLWIVEDVTQERRTEATLRKTLRETEAFIQNASVAILSTRDRRVVRYNPKFAEMFGIVGDSAVGVPVHVLYRSEEEYAAISREARPLLAQGKPFQKEFWMRRQNGTDFWVNLIGYVLNPDQPNEGTVWICEDRTIVKQQEIELARSTHELARSNADLEQFAYVASHDLQEPLRMVGSYVQLLEQRYKDKLDGDAKVFIGYAVDGAKRMQSLINDLLAYSRIATKGKPFAPIDCERVLATVLANLRLRIQETGAKVTHDPLPTVMGDASQLTQLMQNFLANAIKFRGDRAPEIHIGVTETDGFWQFSVRDNGIGIAPEYFERIFVLFQRLHGRDTYPGTGIGLAVCKKVVERHGGRVWVESVPNCGSTFHFTLAQKKEHGS